MSLLIGTNIRRDGSDPIDLIATSEATFARFVPMPNVDLTVFLRGLLAREVLPVAVLAKESFGFGGRIDWGLAQRMLSEYATRYGHLVTTWQIGNEFDMESDSSWTMALSDLVRLGRMARDTFGQDAYLIVGGAADGSASDEPAERLSSVNLDWADAIAIHTYGQSIPGWTRDDGIAVLPFRPYGFPSTLRDLIDGYHAEAPEKDLWITEMGFRWDELGETRAAQYADAYLGYLANRCPEVTAFTQFCLTDDQVPGFGLYTGAGHAHQTAPIFARYARESRMQQPPVVIPPEPARPLSPDEAKAEAYKDLFLAADGSRTRGIVYADHLGIVKYWREHHQELGSAVGPERPAADGSIVYQAFALGIVRWDKDSGAERVA